MSLLPFMFREMLAMSRPLRLLENHMRLSEEMFKSFAYPSITRLEESLEREQGKMLNDEKVVQDGEKFEIQLDVSNFKPQEITVKAIDNLVKIEAKHEEKNDEIGYLARHLVRSFTVPKDHELKNIVSKLSSDGILTVTAPKSPEAIKEEKVIPITFMENEKKH